MGLKKQQLNIIDVIGSHNIFRKYFGEFSYRKAYHSVFRTDNKKSTGFYLTKNNQTIYNDFVTGDKYNCISFVAKKYNISIKEAINKIKKDFNVTNGGVGYISFPKIKKEKRKKFKIYYRDFTKKDLEWWADYYITENELKQNNIISVKKLVIENNIIKAKDDLRYAFIINYEDKKHIKLYSPTDTNYKWLFLGSIKAVHGLDTLNFKNKKLIITKSIKDYIVLKKFFINVICLQNESLSAIDDELLKKLKILFKEIIVFFDLDRPGIYAVNQYRKKFKITPFIITFYTENIWQDIKYAKKVKVKDPSDYVKKYGLDALQKLLKPII